MSNLTSSNLSGALLVPSMFREVILNHADLSDSQLTTVQFIDCQINSVNFSGADLDMAFFINSDLTQSIFTKASCVDTKFNNSILKNIIGANN
jgi:uncharacterized protein YjbI with pentapeptide repeats